MDSATELFRVAHRLFLFLTAFRRQVQRGVVLSVSDVSDRLSELFAQQERDARRDPRVEQLYEKARYPLAALADETVLQSTWEHARQWEGRLLEQRFFGSSVAGEQYFTLIDELRPKDVELALIFYSGLALGFAGKYRGQPETLLSYRKKLYRQLSDYLTLGDRLTPEAYRVAKAPPRRLSPMVTTARVAALGVGLVVFYWIATFTVWSSAVSDVRRAAEVMKGGAAGLATPSGAAPRLP